jgi:dolichol-phosphate mannosyltransferase
MNKEIKYSVLIPLKDEEGNIADLINELEPVMNNLKQPWELICVEDGSKDRTKEILTELSKTKSYLRVIVFSKNFGQSSAFDAGFKAAKGEYVITLDGDRQNDPSDIPKMVKIAESCDLVCGSRVNRQDPWTKKVISKIANRIRGRICGDNVRDTGCSLKVYRRECLRNIKMYQGMHRFLPALFAIEGFRVQEVPVNHRPRTQGATKYNFFNRSFNTIADMWAVHWMKKRQLRYKVEREIS